MMNSALISDHFKKEEGYWWHVSKREMVLSCVDSLFGNGNNPLRTLDVGCGTGFLTKRLEDYGTAFGLDSSEESLRYGRKRGVSNLCRYHLSDDPLPFRDEAFHLVLALDILEHLEDDRAVLAELARVMKRGGLIILTVPAFQWLWSGWDLVLGHRRRYSLGEISRQISSAGFRIKKMSYIFCLIFPLAVLVRFIKGFIHRFGGKYSSDFIPLPRFVNDMLIGLGRWERSILARHSLPCGLSILCIAEKEIPYNEPFSHFIFLITKQSNK